jgi:CheY-like chemotaxis protein
MDKDIREHEKAEGLRRVPVVAISGNVQPAEQASYFQAGMDGFLGKYPCPDLTNSLNLQLFSAKPFKRDEFLRMLNRYKPKSDLTEAAQLTRQTPPVVRRTTNSVPAVSQSAGATTHPSTPEHSTYPQTAPPAQTSRPKQYKTSSPVPFTTAQSEPELSLGLENREANVEAQVPEETPPTPKATNRRTSISALAAPYNVIPLNSSAAVVLPPVPEEPEEPEEPETTSPSYPTPTSTPVHNNNTPYPHTPSQTQTPPPQSHIRRASSPARVSFQGPDSHIPPSTATPRTPSPQAPPTNTPQTAEPVDTNTPTPQNEYGREYVSQEFQIGEHSHNVRILVADNSHADRQIYKRMLSQYQADIVGSGTSALDLFDTNNYDVILLDCNLEGILDIHE